MRICVLTHTFPRNNKDIAAAFMKEFTDGLTQNGHQVILVTPYDTEFNRTGDPFKIYLYRYIWPDILHTLGYSKTMKADVGLKFRAYFLIPFMVLFGTLKLIFIIKKEEIDLINAHWILPNGFIAMLASLVTGVPYVVTLPGTDTSVARHNPVFSSVAKIVAMRAKGIVSNSSWLLNRIMSLGVQNKSTAVISYSADVSKFKPSQVGLEALRKKLNLAKNSLVVLAVGRLVYKKGFNYLIQAMPRVLQKHKNTMLIIAGEGDIKEELLKQVEKLKMEKHVKFVGNIDRGEIGYYYNLCDVLVAPSIVDQSGNADGGPLVALESMACGKPQIVTNILGVSDLIQNGINGYSIPQKNSKAISDSLIKLFASKNLREKMGKINRKIVVNNLDTKAIGKKYTQFFNSLQI